MSETTVPFLKVSTLNTKMAEHVCVSLFDITDDSTILTGTIYGILNECVCSRGVTVHKHHSPVLMSQYSINRKKDER